MRLVCYYLRKRVKNVPLYYNGNFGTIPLIGHSALKRIEYSNLDNALASRRKLYNRYGIVFDVAAYGYDIDKSGRVSNYSYELADYGDDFGNPPAYKRRKHSTVFNKAYDRGYAAAVNDFNKDFGGIE